jgi:transposase-like protein
MQTNGKFKHEKFRVEQVIQAIQDTGGVVSKAAQRLGCSRRTVQRYVQQYATVAQALLDERESMTEVAELALFDKIREGDLSAITFYLRTQGKDRGYSERQEKIHSGPGGGPIRTEQRVADASTIAESARILADIRKNNGATHA